MGRERIEAVRASWARIWEVSWVVLFGGMGGRKDIRILSP